MEMKMIGNDTDEIRVKWVIEALSNIPKGFSILDVGAGELKFKKYCKHLNYTAQDFCEYTGVGDNTGLQTADWDVSSIDIVSDINQIPIEGQTMDVVLCTEVLEHVPDAVSALKEFSRIIKPGGVLLLTAPFSSLTHFAPYHFCGYNKYWYQHHLHKLGFDIEVVDHNGSWFHFVAQELRRSRLVGRMYSLKWLGLIVRVAVIPILMLLTILSRFDRGSHEILCFGYMVRAVKVK
jgi:ubiquinone/menaquinone biosynthesis C-methylase UbiE